MNIPTLARSAAIVVFCSALFSGSQPALAAPVFEVSGNGGQGSFSQSSSSFLSRASNAEGSSGGPGQSSGSADNAFAAAGPGLLRADANSKVFRDQGLGAPGFFFDRIDASANAAMTLDDVVISGPAGTLLTSFNIHLSGTLEAFKDAQATSELSGAAATIALQLLGSGHLLNDNSAVKFSGLPQIGNGLLQNFIASSDLTSDAFSITVNQPFTITIRLGISARSDLDVSDSGATNAAAHFSNTLTFVTDGPVFDLPVGYSVNSISGNIANNRFVLTTIPLPAPIWLLGSAFAGIGFMMRRRAK